ncbi:MAG: 50S ribosomal protein L2 [Elusimicrobia bacterium]|nr:50S ribosomal protein L2 [Elusimicrobiota bacterium]MDE2425313.1 50S ribosomal protein L2 [Elusimicrobiota bacterium]
MAIKTFKPYTPSRRGMTSADYSELTADRPQKSLLSRLVKTGGRNNTGTLMVRHHGGGHKRVYRIVDFKRDKFGVPGKIATIEYDPNRTARICLVHYADGEKRYILHPVGIKVGDTIVSGPQADIKVGNALPLKDIPEGHFVHNVELIPGKGGQMMRSAGTQAQLMAKDGGYAQLKMPSGEIRLVPENCMATLGQVSNTEHNTIRLGKAGRNRHRGVRPTVRGGAMNATDHPMGGGRGKSKGGNHPRSPWNQLAKGYKTRDRKKVWGWMIVSDRRRAKQA